MIIGLVLTGLVIAVIGIIYNYLYGRDIGRMKFDELTRYMTVYIVILIISLIFTLSGAFL